MLQSNTNRGSLRNSTHMDQESTSSGPHRNMILEIREKSREASAQRVKEISTCGLDGRIVIWNMDLILSKMNV